MPLRAVCLDFDGVLADTENIHIAAWQRTLAALGWEASDELCARSMEVDDRQFLAEIFERRKIEGGNIDGWVRRKQELTAMLLADSPRVYPGVADLIQSLRARRVHVAVVTTTWRENVEIVLKSAGLTDLVELIVGKEDVTAVKPDPECYVQAIKHLKVAAKSAAAIEDSPTGLAAAQGAKLRTIAVGHRRPHGDWVGTSSFLPDLAETGRVLEALGLS
jgi:HAD superfamily hydrolase (TIGR01509 family)